MAMRMSTKIVENTCEDGKKLYNGDQRLDDTLGNFAFKSCQLSLLFNLRLRILYADNIPAFYVCKNFNNLVTL